MADASTGEPILLSPVTVITGDEEVLVDRAVTAVLRAARGQDPQADVRDPGAGAVTAELVAELATPSMFGNLRVLVARAAQDCDEATQAALLGWARLPLDDTVLVIHSGGQARRFPDAVTAAGARVVRCPRVTRYVERLEFVQAELRAAGRPPTAGACRLLVDAIGPDLRDLAGACAQLAAETIGGLDEVLVGRYYRGHAETTGFAVADAAIGGDRSAALALLGQALGSGTPPVLVTSALAAALRDVGRVRGVGSGRAVDAAKTLGMPPWKVEKAQRQARGWSDDGLSVAVTAVARADLDVKGAGVDPAYALERAVLAVSQARAGGPR